MEYVNPNPEVISPLGALEPFGLSKTMPGSKDAPQPLILSQQQLITKLREYGIVVCSLTVHSWIRSGCPIIPGWKKPKFILSKVLEWLHSAHQPDPIEQAVRDRSYKRSLKRSA